MRRPWTGIEFIRRWFFDTRLRVCRKHGRSRDRRSRNGPGSRPSRQRCARWARCRGCVLTIEQALRALGERTVVMAPETTLQPSTHFSVCMSKARRMCRFTACNVEGGALQTSAARVSPGVSTHDSTKSSRPATICIETTISIVDTWCADSIRCGGRIRKPKLRMKTRSTSRTHVRSTKISTRRHGTIWKTTCSRTRGNSD